MKRVVLAGAIWGLVCWFEPAAQAYIDYYQLADLPQAQTEARERKLPLAFLGSFPDTLTESMPRAGGTGDLTQMALHTLQDHAVVVFFDGRNMNVVPPFIHAQYHIHDDGELPNGAAWTSPKVVMCDPAMTKILGRVSFTQMKSDREYPINSLIQTIRNDPTSLDPVAGATAGVDNSAPGATAPAQWLAQYGFYIGAGVVILIVLLLMVNDRSKS